MVSLEFVVSRIIFHGFGKPVRPRQWSTSLLIVRAGRVMSVSNGIKPVR